MNVLNKIKSKKAVCKQQVIPKQQIIPKQQAISKEGEAIQRLAPAEQTGQLSKAYCRSSQEISVEKYRDFKQKQSRVKGVSGPWKYCLQVKRGYSLADISVFEGDLAHKESRRPIKISCCGAAVANPELVAQIKLTQICFLSNLEAIFSESFLVQIIYKCHK